MKKYYCKDKCFENVEEFTQYREDWPNLPFDRTYFTDIIGLFLSQIDTNENMRNYTNERAYKLLKIMLDI